MNSLIFPLHSCFLALPLEENAAQLVQDLHSVLKEYDDILRLETPGNPHVTLHFWQEVMAIEYDPIVGKGRGIAAKSIPFDLKIEGLSTFGSKGEDHVLFLEVPFSEPLAKVKKLCPWPDPAEHKPFHPHCTLARITHPQKFNVVKKEIFKKLKNISFETHVGHLRLYAEIDGIKQTPIKDFIFSKMIPQSK